jgi:hypothetical protein
VTALRIAEAGTPRRSMGHRRSVMFVRGTSPSSTASPARRRGTISTIVSGMARRMERPSICSRRTPLRKGIALTGSCRLTRMVLGSTRTPSTALGQEHCHSVSEVARRGTAATCLLGETRTSDRASAEQGTPLLEDLPIPGAQPKVVRSWSRHCSIQKFDHFCYASEAKPRVLD